MNNRFPLISDIFRGSHEDGAGIRTVIFLKGCTLRCQWCHNPELQDIKREKMFSLEKCRRCEPCEDDCNFSAKKFIGNYYEPAKLAKIIIKYKQFYNASGGGVTFSGGEPLMFTEYITKVAKILKKENL